MKHLIFVLFFAGSAFTPIFSQEKSAQKHLRYNTFYEKGVLEMRNKYPEKAILYFDSASAIFPYFHKPYFESIFCAVRLGDYNRVYEYGIKMISTGTSFSILIPDYLGDFIKSPQFEKLTNEEASVYETCMQTKDTAFGNAILRLEEKSMSRWKAFVRDTAIFQELVTLCEQFGEFPSYINVGTTAYRSAMLLISNTFFDYPHSAEWQKLLPMIKKKMDQGEIEISSYSLWEDSYCIKNDLPLLYGLGLFSGLYGEDYILPSKEELNSNRVRIGLAPIELQAESIGIDLNSFLEKHQNR